MDYGKKNVGGKFNAYGASYFRGVMRKYWTTCYAIVDNYTEDPSGQYKKDSPEFDTYKKFAY